MTEKLKADRTRSCAAQAALVFALVATVYSCGCTSPTKAHAGGMATIPHAAVVRVVRRNLSSELRIASEFLPNQEIDVYAKVSGYVKKLYIDWGTHVREGQLLAVLEIPELKEQIDRDQAAVDHAKEDLNRSQSAYTVAHVTYTRLANVQKTQPELVAQQDIDVAQGKDLEASAAVSAAKQALLAAQATLEKDQTMYGYAHMTAPFDGVVTQMYAYTGALLPAGTRSNIGDSALCHLAENDLLRLVIPVPERAVPDVRLGEVVNVNVSALNRTFSGKIVRTADQINMATRTMHTEVSVPNPAYKLVPGMYASVEIPLQTDANALTLPIQAVESSGNGIGTVLVVNSQNQIEQRQVKLGLQTPDNYEILSGLKEGDEVVFGEQDQFKPGETVVPQIVKPLTQAG
ncbi:MAG TPA: efflux RND transporter periplasmic adaptor subunit [Candidatus Acidoferrum sp.]|nr:efflux RND transporter periplasmic adaptor subunit [Candidatus Acidoferrum sp.]